MSRPGSALAAISDQVVYSSVGMLAIVFGARALAPIDFATFAGVILAYQFVAGLLNAFFLQPLVLKGSSLPEKRMRTDRMLIGYSIVSLGVAAIGVLYIAWSSEAPRIWLVGAISFPLYATREALRAWSAYVRRPSIALATDGIWLLVFCASFAILSLSDEVTRDRLFYCWITGVSASLAVQAAVYMRWRRSAIDSGTMPISSRQEFSGYLGWRFLLEHLLTRGASQAVTLALGIVIAVEIVGAIRGAATALGPLTILLSAMSTFAIPIVREHSDSGYRRIALILGVIAVASTVVYGLLLILAPLSVGTYLLGENWVSIRSVLGPFWLELVFLSVSTVVNVFIRILSPRSSLPIRFLSCSVLLTAGGGLYLMSGASLVLWAFPLSSGVYAIASAVVFFRVSRKMSFASGKA